MSDPMRTTDRRDLQPARWYYLDGSERRGPVGLDDVRELVLEGSLRPTDWVWADGMPDWSHVDAVPALVPPRALRITLTGWPEEPGDVVDPRGPGRSAD